MSAHGIFAVPEPYNEPVRGYAPGAPEREELRVRLAELEAQQLELPLVIGGEEVRTGDTFVLAFVDVNNLKARNDTHGHHAGDELLRKIADTLRANVRSYDLVVRYGGDEFVCGFPALDVNDAAERFARINGDLAATAEASVAFGLAELETDDSLADLITRADSVMYANRSQRSLGRGNSANTVTRTSSTANAEKA